MPCQKAETMHPFFHKLMSQIPGYIWGLLLVVLLLVLDGVVRMLRQGRNLRGRLAELANLMAEAAEGSEFRRGLSLTQLEAIRARAAQGSAQVQQWWRRLEQQLEAYQGAGASRGYFLARAARDVLPEGELVEALYDGGRYQALPGIVTSLGLAGTFLAILVGLFHVSYNSLDHTQPVQGIDQLINNLSGKFASSLVALSLGILFIFLEKWTERANRLAYDRMIAGLEQALPLLTPVRILADLQASALKQEVALRSISSEMVDGFKVAFAQEINPALSAQFSQNLMEELQPTLLRMTDTLGVLNTSIQRLETNKHDSLLKELTIVIQAMHGSIIQGLQGMGKEFHSALTGSARLELEGMQQSMESARTVLDQLSHRFEQVQDGFSGMMDTQTSGLTRTVETLGQRLELMGAQMVETMGTAQISAQLQVQDSIRGLSGLAGAAQHGLLESLEQGRGHYEAAMADMLERLDKAQLHALHAGQASLSQMDALVAKARDQVALLVGSVEDGAKEFARSSDRLVSAQESLDGSLGTHLAGLKVLREMGGELSSLQGLLTDLVEKARGTSAKQSEQTSELTALMGQLGQLQAGGGDLLKGYASSFSGTQQRLGTLDQDLAKAFAVIHEGMGTWTGSVDHCLRSLTTETNEHLGAISRTFSRQIADLGDKLDDFGEALDRVIERSREPGAGVDA